MASFATSPSKSSISLSGKDDDFTASSPVLPGVDTARSAFEECALTGVAGEAASASTSSSGVGLLLLAPVLMDKSKSLSIVPFVTLGVPVLFDTSKRLAIFGFLGEEELEDPWLFSPDQSCSFCSFTSRLERLALLLETGYPPEKDKKEMQVRISVRQMQDSVEARHRLNARYNTSPRNETNSETNGGEVKCLLSLTVGLEICISSSHLASWECDLFLVHDCSCCLL
jgi:hypothetical protein